MWACRTLEYSRWRKSTVVWNFFWHCADEQPALNSPLFSPLFIRSHFLFSGHSLSPQTHGVRRPASSEVLSKFAWSWSHLEALWGSYVCYSVQPVVNMCLLTASISPVSRSLPKIRGRGAVMCFLFNTAATSGYKHLSLGPGIATVLAFCMYLIYLIAKYSLVWKWLRKYAKCISFISFP